MTDPKDRPRRSISQGMAHPATIERGFPLLMMMAAFAGAVPEARAQAGGFALDPEVVYEVGANLFEYAPDSIKQKYAFPSKEEWTLFWAGVETTLQADSLDALADMAPEAEEALDYLRMSDVTAPYADWLEQRLDYFDMARNVLQIIPSPGARPVATAPATKTPKIAPIRKPSAPPPPPAVEKGRRRYVQSESSWDRKLKSRPAPSRAGEWVPRLKAIFNEEGVPAQWVWLAEVESSFNPNARSPVGAAGLYQFMPATAQRFGLQVSPRDERLVPEKSARAAAKYMKLLYRQFQSWPLTFAAYNAGEGRVARLLKEAPSRTFEAIDDRLPVETQMYVPKIMAVVRLREGLDPARIPPPSARLAYPSVMVTARIP